MPTTDHFSRQAALYQASRPDYPPELFSFLAGVGPAGDLAPPRPGRPTGDPSLSSST